MRRLGIFGGTFDPPHIGHLILAEEAAVQLGLLRVLWVLTPDPPHKEDVQISPLADRLEMLRAAIADNPSFEVSPIDIEREPPHYAADTMRLLAGKYPQAELYYLMGGDSLRDLPGWHDPSGFVAACDGIAVKHRPGAEVELGELESRLPGITSKVHFVHSPLLEISSSEIRHRVRSGASYRYYLPAQVYQLILAKSLYAG